MKQTSSHALLNVLVANGLDRVFLVPGESYLGILDAMNDFPEIDVVTCRHEGGAGFMAATDGRLKGKPGVVMVSRGPGATNAAIALHAAEQDAVPLILIIGQVPKKDLRRNAFQEIDYQKFFDPVAKWVAEPTTPEQLAEVAFKAVRIASSGKPGPVVIVVPEDIQQQEVPIHTWKQAETVNLLPTPQTLEQLRQAITQAKRPLIIAGDRFDIPGGREALVEFAESWQIPVAVSFRRHDIFDNTHPLYAGDLGLVNPSSQINAFRESDLILALGTRLGDITSQGYSFPDLPVPSQTFVHCYPEQSVVGMHFAPDYPLVCDPVELVKVLRCEDKTVNNQDSGWVTKLRQPVIENHLWPKAKAEDGIPFVNVIEAVYKYGPQNLKVCLDAGTFAAPVYKHFPFVYPQRLIAGISGAMGCGTPSALATQMRYPDSKVVCMVGDGGFLMTGNEMILAVERQLPILFILSHNQSYASIRIHQEREYPGRKLGTSLFNPNFSEMAASFGMKSICLKNEEDVDKTIEMAMQAKEPLFIEVMSSLNHVLPK